jgi:hypothetical protein
VPSLEQIAKCEDADYYKFTTKWQPLGATQRGAMHAIIYAHGHETAWNAQLMRDTLFFVGFDDVRQCQPGWSEDVVLQHVEGHGNVIGEHFNAIESCTHEGRKYGNVQEIGVAAEEVAVVIGGAECWQRDLEDARELLVGHKIKYFYINDHIKTFPDPGIACTLHPDKLNGTVSWLINRRRAGLPEPDEIWAHHKHAAVNHDTASRDWSGSSGLFAVQVALRKGHKKVIACGIPMTIEGSHFQRHINWQSAIGFRNGWMTCRHEIAPYVRSMSGWTREILGFPDKEWIDKIL